MRRPSLLALFVLCAALLLTLPRGARAVQAAPAQDDVLFTVGGDVQTPLSITTRDLDWLPVLLQAFVCPGGQTEQFLGYDPRGFINAAGPLTSDPADYIVTITGAAGDSISMRGDAIAPLLTADHPGGMLLVMPKPTDPLLANAGPVAAAGQSCDRTHDVAGVTAIVVNVAAGAPPPGTRPQSIDSEAGLTAAALQPGDLPGYSLRFSLAQPFLAPQPHQPVLHYEGYWSQDETRLAETIYTYTDTDSASQMIASLPNAVPVAADAANCDESSVQFLDPLGLGDEDATYTYVCPGETDADPDLLIATDVIRIGRVTTTVAVAMPQPGDAVAAMQAAAPIAAARLAAASQ